MINYFSFMGYQNYLWLIFAYLLGSVPFGLIIAKKLCHIDPRTDGSGNVGATNVARLCGKSFGIATLILDILKGFIAVAGAVWYFKLPESASLNNLTLLSPDSYDSFSLLLQFLYQHNQTIFISLSALFAILGHLYSVFLKFKGGKAVATTIGIYLPILFPQILLACLICIVVIKYCKFISLGSLVLVTAVPFILITSLNFTYLPLSIVIMLLVFFSHRTNIIRLLHKQEKTWQKK